MFNSLGFSTGFASPGRTGVVPYGRRSRPPSPGHSEVHGGFTVAVPLVIKFADLGLEVPQFTLQVVTASLLIQEARILGEQELRKSSWHYSQSALSCSALSIIHLSFDYTVPASGQHHTHTQPNR